MCTDVEKLKIATKYLPEFHIHSKEKYNSILIRAYISMCTPYGDNHLRPNDSCKKGVKDQLQILANVVELTNESGEPVTDIVYYLFFPYNGPVGALKQGAHWYDMEHVTLRFKCSFTYLSMCWFSDSATFITPCEVLFSIHSKFKWINWESSELTKTNNNSRLVVFVAQNSHACYPQPKTYWRYLGFGNDSCDYGSIPSNSVIMIYNPFVDVFLYKCVDGSDDESHNWNRRELRYGEFNAPHSQSITSYMYT
jgi:hypothetical protein